MTELSSGLRWKRNWRDGSAVKSAYCFSPGRGCWDWTRWLTTVLTRAPGKPMPSSAPAVLVYVNLCRRTYKQINEWLFQSARTYFVVVVLRFCLKLYYIAKDGHELRTLLPLSLKCWYIRRSPQCPPHEVLGVELMSLGHAGWANSLPGDLYAQL